jgi:hypothetical protein
VIYGVVVIGALLAAESGSHETYADTIISALIAAAIYWLAHAYANALGWRVATRQRLTAGVLSRELIHDWAIVRGAAIPLLVLALAWAAGATLETAVNAALGATVATLIAFELIAGIGSQATGRELILDVSVGAAMGVAIVTLKVLLH